MYKKLLTGGGWSSGNAIAFIISGSGERTAEAYEGSPSDAAVLTITANFTPPPRDALPAIISNNNRGLPFIYYMADNRSELYAVAPDPTAIPLPSPTITNITYGGSPITFSGEGGGYRSTDRQVYVFQGRNSNATSDLYAIDPSTGITTLAKSDIVPGHVEGAEFYINNVTGEEVLVVVHRNGTSGGSHQIMAINPNANGTNPAWSPYAGYPKNISGDRTTADGISWDPVSSNFYIQNDDTVDYYTIDIATGVTAYAFRTSLAVDGEGITYASDGENYIEDEGQAGQGRKIFKVDITTGNLIPVAELGSTGDVESIMGNLGVRNDAGDAPSTYGYAAHILPVLVATPVSIYLGNIAPDSEDPFVNFSTGSSDDNNGDDEDGVTSGGIDFSGQLLDLGSTKVIDIITNGAGVLNAWIDFNRDGDFDDLGEQIASDVAPSGGSITLNVAVPATASIGTSYARFRFSSDTGLPPGNSEASNGEVEDYQVIFRDNISCGPGYTMTESISYTQVYATSVTTDNSVNNASNSLGNNDSTTARFNNDNDELILEMGEEINKGDAVTVNGPDEDVFDIWVSSSATGPWTQVGNAAALDYTFSSPFNWLYIRLKRGSGVDNHISYIDADKSISNYGCAPDNDGDGIPDRTDLDDDNDGIPDDLELSTIISNSQPSCGGETTLDFSAAATLVSGTALTQGAVYRIPNITAGTDALITIAQTVNATVANLDNNSTEPAAFKPQTAFNFANVGDRGYIEYKIDFVNSGGSTPVIINKFFMNFNDIDGGANYAEENWADNPSTYIIDNPTELTMSNDGSWIIATGSILDHSGSGNADPEVNFGVNYNSKSQITIRVGAMARVAGASAGGRQHNIEFFCVTNYLSPDTYGLDSDSDGIANHLDLDSDNDGIYDAVEAGHNQPHTNGVVNSGYGANGLANIVETSPESGVINYSIRNTDGTAPPDYLDEDSDDDGCKDANEAYGNVAADSDGNGYYGSGNPPIVNTDGTVTAASYSNPVDGDSNGMPDYLEAEAAPLITTQPTDSVICANGNTSFSVTATNVSTYQWQIYNGSVWSDVTDTGIHSGATTNTLGITNGQMSDNGNQYRVIVSNTSFICSSETSNTVTLTIVQPIAPVSGGDQEECADSPVQTLTATATVPVGSNLVWFDAPVGGNVVASPTLNSVGTITYYAESQDGSTACPSSTRTPVSLTIHPRPTISVTRSASCNIFLTAYSLEVTVSSGTVSSTAGTVINTAGNLWDITDVPSGTDIVVTVTDANGCSRDLPVSAPDCSCPVVNAPNSGGDKAYCTGDPVPSIDASVEVGETVDWYDSASGGVLLLSGNTSFTPSGAGTYYAEARNSITNCISNSRTPITVIEDSPPTATISADRTVFVNQNASFTVITANADTYQWQLSTDGGTVFYNIVNGPEYSGTQSISLTVKTVEIDKNNNRYRLLASKSGSSCALIASPSALLRVRVRTVITNRRITHRVKKN